MSIKELSDLTEKVITSYGKKYDIDINSDFLVFKLQEELGEFVQSYLNQTGRNRRKMDDPVLAKEAVENELADVFAFVLLIAGKLDIDIERAVNNKWKPYLQQ